MLDSTYVLAEGGVGGFIVLLIYLAILVGCIAGMWKVFEKANQPGWGAIDRSTTSC